MSCGFYLSFKNSRLLLTYNHQIQNHTSFGHHYMTSLTMNHLYDISKILFFSHTMRFALLARASMHNLSFSQLYCHTFRKINQVCFPLASLANQLSSWNGRFISHQNQSNCHKPAMKKTYRLKQSLSSSFSFNRYVCRQYYITQYTCNLPYDLFMCVCQLTNKHRPDTKVTFLIQFKCVDSY